MWIFGYGSLMADGWEKKFGASQQKWAELLGYRRSFNKKSVQNWGTKVAPGLTLNLEQFAGANCKGVAFEFVGGDHEKIRAHLRKREACDPTEVTLRFESGAEFQALTYIYRGLNLLPGEMSANQKAALILSAKGKSGTGSQYVQQTYDTLQKVGIDDPAVTELWNAIQAAKT